MTVKHIGAEDRDLEAGRQVGEYKVVEKIGEGGFGTVFRAEHPLIGKQVAIKVLGRQFSSDEEMVSRFVSEAAAVNRIRHRNIIDIFSFGQLEDGRHYYIMELLSGRPLDDYLHETGPLPLDAAIPILRGVARALDAAHKKGIVHRDLKPENIFLLEEEGAPPFPKLLDFGIAKLLRPEDKKGYKTRTGVPMGTPMFMAPEQCRGKDVDHRADIYSFGIVCYQILSGKLPFDGEDYMEILMAQISSEPELPSVICPTIPPRVDDAIAWMMRKAPGQRPPDLASAMQALEDVASEAGIELPAAPKPSIGYSRASDISTESFSTENKSQSDIASAPTEVGSLPTLAPLDSEAEAEKLPARSPWPILAAFVVVGALAGAAFMALGGDGDTENSSGTTSGSGQEEGKRAVLSPASKADAQAPDRMVPQADAAVLSKYVRIEIRNVPKGTEVYSPSGLVGTAPGDLQLERGEEAMSLTFKAKGHRSKTLSVSVDKDSSLDVEGLTPKKRRPPKEGTGNKDPKNTKDTIDDPFDD